MRYQGGKFIAGPHIAKVINSLVGDRDYIEPFVGGCNVLPHVKARRRYASDLSLDAIELYRALQKGWEPPDFVSEDEYEAAKNNSSSALRGFIGYGCTFGAKWFGGFARGYGKDGTQRNYATESKRSLLKIRDKIDDVSFHWGDYKIWSNSIGALIYCDPPYAGTCKFKTGAFDHVAFWDWVRMMSKENVVLISEYQAPGDFKCIWTKETGRGLRKKSGDTKQTEKLFQHI